jgi:hypothetical protein
MAKKKRERMRTKETYLSHTAIIIMMMYFLEYELFFFTLVNETKIDNIIIQFNAYKDSVIKLEVKRKKNCLNVRVFING